MKTKIKMKDGEILDGYLLNLVGGFENKNGITNMIFVPPPIKKNCPCIVFAKERPCSKYSFIEITSCPFINIESLKDLNQLVNLYKK